MKKINIGYCRLCGEHSKLSFEHIPPGASGNNKPIFVQNHLNLLDQNSQFYNKRMKSNRGLGDTGYVKNVINLLEDGMLKTFPISQNKGCWVSKI
jgi:hypothetical protein